NRTSVIGTTAAFTVVATGSAPLGYRWLFNGTNLSEGGQFTGTATATLSLNSLIVANGGGYSVVVTNSGGSVTSATATLTVSLPDCVSAPGGLVGWWPGDGNANDIFGTNNGIL